MRKGFLGWLVLGLLVSLVLAACGDNTTVSTAQPAAAGATAAATSGSMTGQSMGAMTTQAAATIKAATSSAATAAGAVPTAMGAMPGIDQGSGGMATAGNDPMTNSLKGLSGREFEANFMQQMIVHHQSAIDMAKLVPTNTKRPELNKLAQNITSAQTKEIGDMTGWLSSWYNLKPLSDSMSVPGMMEMMGSMDKLKNSKDAQFDEMFLRMMIEHHQQAVNMANLLPSKTQRPELLKLGQDIIKTQTAEIDQMKSWQKTWNLKA